MLADLSMSEIAVMQHLIHNEVMIYLRFSTFSAAGHKEFCVQCIKKTRDSVRQGSQKGNVHSLKMLCQESAAPFLYFALQVS